MEAGDFTAACAKLMKEDAMGVEILDRVLEGHKKLEEMADEALGEDEDRSPAPGTVLLPPPEEREGVEDPMALMRPLAARKTASSSSSLGGIPGLSLEPLGVITYGDSS